MGAVNLPPRGLWSIGVFGGSFLQKIVNMFFIQNAGLTIPKPKELCTSNSLGEGPNSELRIHSQALQGGVEDF